MTIWKGHKPEAAFLQPTTTWILRPQWRVPFVNGEATGHRSGKETRRSCNQGICLKQSLKMNSIELESELKLCEASRSNTPKDKKKKKKADREQPDGEKSKVNALRSKGPRGRKEMPGAI